MYLHFFTSLLTPRSNELERSLFLWIRPWTYPSLNHLLIYCKRIWISESEGISLSVYSRSKESCLCCSNRLAIGLCLDCPQYNSLVSCSAISTNKNVFSNLWWLVFRFLFVNIKSLFAKPKLLASILYYVHTFTRPHFQVEIFPS